VPVFESHDGAELHYDILGEGRSREPIIVLGGGAARHPEYLGDLAGLDSVRTLLILHQRAVGRSAAATPAAWPQLAHDVTALRRHLDLGRIDLLAHSAGTRIAIAYATAHPDTLHRLCLVTPPAQWLVEAEDDTAAMIESRRGEPWFDDFEKIRPALAQVSSYAGFRELAPAGAPLGYAVWDDRARAHDAVGDWYDPAGEAFFSRPADPRTADRLATVRAPVLVVAGRQDALVGLAPVLALAELFPAGRSVVIDAAGHYPWVEQPTAFRHAVDEFFTTEPPRRD
jgi:proline iminopeptidase